MKAFLPIFALVCALPTAARAAAPSQADLDHFEQKIRPVLIERCYACHSQEAAAQNKLKGGLLVDSASGLLKGGDSGPAIVPGKAKESLLYKALRFDGYEMPPSGKLPEAVVADFAAWIDRGAADPRTETSSQPAKPAIDFAAARKHWAFQPPQKPARPKVNDSRWPQTEIDYFILAKLEPAGLKPVAPATKRELLRRATFDLIGLPPTPEEVTAFESDEAPDAFAKVVDRLLASPHYGERWGRHWLDVARYAEDQAHTFGVRPNTSGYRYRDWVVQALNDDLPYDEFVRLQIAADKFAPQSTDKQSTAKQSADKQDPSRLKHVAALGFFGLGAQYYKNTDAAKASADELDDRIDTMTRGFLGLTVSCARCHDHKFDPIPTQDYYSLAGVFQSCTLNNTPLAPQEQVAAYDDGQKRIKKAEDDLKKFVAEQKQQTAEAEAARIAKYVEAAWRVHTARRADAAKKPMPELAKRYELNEATLAKWVDFLDMKNKGRNASFDELRNLCASATTAESGQAMPANLAAASTALEQRLKTAFAARREKKEKPEHRDLLEAVVGNQGLFTPNDGELAKRMAPKGMEQWNAAKAEVDTAKKAAPPIYPLAHTIADAKPTDMKVFIRGNPARTGELAPRRFLKILAGDEPKPFADGSGRRELAEAIASADNPLTARVIVNRLWQRHFGRGIVGTPSNFGLLGDRPTHPELLDYLAVRLVEKQWSLKAIHREIMLSAVYRLGSASDASNERVDADNRLLWRMDRRRLDVEAWRDSLLAVSGRLDPKLGGESTDLGSSSNVRRTIYGKISRHELDSLLRLFDFPDANITSDTRSETTVPQQQLFVLNSPFMIEQSKAFAARLAKEAPSDERARVVRAFALAYGRAAEEAEIAGAVEYLAAADTADDAKKNKLTRWERLAQALLSSNEFLYID
jgi:cytochrome c553